jgi:hypothetical protein
MKDSAGKRLRGAGLVAAALAITAGAVITGCTNNVKGNAAANEQDLTSYRAEATSSSQAATSSSKAAAAVRAKSNSCATYSVNAKPQVSAHNAFVKAQDDNAPDLVTKRQAAIDAHNTLITRLNGSLSSYSSSLASNVSSGLSGYITATRAVLAETEKQPPIKDALNGAIDRLRTASGTADSACK